MTTKEKKRVQVQVDKDLAENTEAVLGKLGLNSTVVINALYSRISATGSLPFELKLSPREKANIDLAEATKDLPRKRITNKDELEAWLSDEEE
ncbi:type II toxin-antitoxin system antitoxin, RelB/DinJ family [Lentilactobacillus parafarraginis]|jgi:DNA-damage-inducible protein J|uniref:Type II toxin-antitoxin system antitoxin, RelB/DinJ family n=1 Tax=Lentilactobacillus parafarraginis TaxID=390842 RepID=A0A5R9CTS0_9LACO|nr:type II toxin-antitoxin system RelB/DinJ family antitoxin [Lentilactobacillus parafarraginis]TLQ18410.1 type II toxin-antitoxin system antitoxin, RelB/DinJ family [Lentilactobacillus parafarraginis]